MPDTACKAELCGRISSAISYIISGGLVVGNQALAFMNNNAAACGVILGILTFLTNLHYQHKSMRCRCGPSELPPPDALD
jgi:hypothetical protein